MQELIYCQGLPGSGKSTWAREFIKENPSYVRVNKDDIRAMLGVTYTKDTERLVVALSQKAATLSLQHGFSVIIDDTNFNDFHKTAFTVLAGTYGATFTFKSFLDVPLEECVRRDSLREGKAKVGGDVIIKMYDKYLAPKEF